MVLIFIISYVLILKWLTENIIEVKYTDAAGNIIE